MSRSQLPWHTRPREHCLDCLSSSAPDVGRSCWGQSSASLYLKQRCCSRTLCNSLCCLPLSLTSPSTLSSCAGASGETSSPIGTAGGQPILLQSPRCVLWCSPPSSSCTSRRRRQRVATSLSGSMQDEAALYLATPSSSLASCGQPTFGPSCAPCVAAPDPAAPTTTCRGIPLPSHDCRPALASAFDREWPRAS